MTGPPRLGLVVNPVAGMGGRVGLKGSDGAETLRRARELGATPEAGNRARVALEALRRSLPEAGIVTWPGEMGEDAALAAGFQPRTLGHIRSGATTAADTYAAARAMLDTGVTLLLYAGGDGTARDILAVVGSTLPTLGIPAGVKVYSATFAVNPERAGELAAAFLRGDRIALREAEVLDLDEAAYRLGRVSPRLAGYLSVPFRAGVVQGGKAPTPPSDPATLNGIAAQVMEQIPGDAACVLGPGTTVRAIAERIGVAKTLTGVDVVRGRSVLAADVGEADLLRMARDEPLSVVVTPIGGQGFIFGRGNPQIGPRVLEHIQRDRLIVVATPGKLAALEGRPLLVDTGDSSVDAALAGYLPVITGYRERSIYRVAT
jgi:predicted polyphosphate/ATP-dependent NAD kinase